MRELTARSTFKREKEKKSAHNTINFVLDKLLMMHLTQISRDRKKNSLEFLPNFRIIAEMVGLLNSFKSLEGELLHI
jgi:hypothetical protein